jgi:hypothetical protein
LHDQIRLIAVNEVSALLGNQELGIGRTARKIPLLEFVRLVELIR